MKKHHTNTTKVRVKTSQRQANRMMREDFFHTGRRFGKLEIKSIFWVPRAGLTAICTCDCGKKTQALCSNIFHNKVKSCGCLRSENKSHALKHGFCRRKGVSAEYVSWSAMKYRCNNQGSKFYKHYGGRGIRVCHDWNNSFSSFLRDMGKRPKGATIDRIDNDKGYSKSNCRWATMKEQNRNTRSNVLVDFRGEKVPISVVAERTGVSYTKIRKRIKVHGVTAEQACYPGRFHKGTPCKG